MTDSSDEFFYKIFIDTSSDEFDDDTEVVVVVTLLTHDNEEDQRLLYRGSLSGRSAAFNRNREASQEQLFLDCFHRTNLVFKENFFRRRFRMSRKVFTKILLDSSLMTITLFEEGCYR
jgi:hypothetical protein